MASESRRQVILNLCHPLISVRQDEGDIACRVFFFRLKHPLRDTVGLWLVENSSQDLFRQSYVDFSQNQHFET
jgi:hypothetical protein